MFTEHLKSVCRQLSSVAIIVFIVLGHSNVNAASRGEYAVKAAFILNFILLTEWPEDVGDGSNEIELCVVGKGRLPKPFKALEGKKIGQKSLRVVPVTVDTTLSRCQVAFFREEVDTENLVRTLNAVRSKPVLTIGEKKNVTKLGGAIHFYIDGNRLRFAINPKVVSEQGLRMSSRLLQIATLIDD